MVLIKHIIYNSQITVTLTIVQGLHLNSFFHPEVSDFPPYRLQYHDFNANFFDNSQWNLAYVVTEEASPNFGTHVIPYYELQYSPDTGWPVRVGTVWLCAGTHIRCAGSRQSTRVPAHRPPAHTPPHCTGSEAGESHRLSFPVTSIPEMEISGSPSTISKYRMTMF
jgi:hypothetical protein